MSTPQYQSYDGTTARSATTPTSRLDVFKAPPDPALLARLRKKKVKVLDEDEFVDQVEKIVERDFFPELEKLKAQNAYLEAKERNDFAAMSHLQDKIGGSTTGGKRILGPTPGASPSTFETPEEARRDFDPKRPFRTNSNSGPTTSSSSTLPSDQSSESVDGEEVVNLDKFLASHTSEDNASFDELQRDATAVHRAKNAWMFKDEAAFLAIKAAEMALPAIEEQADQRSPTKRQLTEPWTFQNINSVFHNPDALELSYEEKLEAAKKQKVIEHANTRLTKSPWASAARQMELVRREAEKAREAALASGKVGPDGKEISKPMTPLVNGYKMMSMAPSPALGVADSPLMTWGEVDSTPFRLEGGETPILTTGASSAAAAGGFTIKDVPERDRLAKELADKNSRYYRDRKAKALQQAKTSLKAGSGSGRPNSSLTTSGGGRLPSLSPAAKRLVSSKLGIRLGTDEMLRSSYTPSPQHRRKGSSTPITPSPRRTPNSLAAAAGKLVKTPSKVKSRVGVNTPSAKTKSSKSSSGSSNISGTAPKRRPPEEEQLSVNTDNLLNISATSGKRQRAQDFFQSSADAS